jgi:hypothetical protein
MIPKELRTKQLRKLALQLNGEVLKDVLTPIPMLRMLEVQQNGQALTYVPQELLT